MNATTFATNVASLVMAETATESNIFQRIVDASIPIGPWQIHWLELIGVLIGLASAILGMKRWVWAWPVGISANIMLFFVYIGAVLGAGERIPLFGQAGRQIFFIITAIYGWYRWNEHRKRRSASGTQSAIVPRWATNKERLVIVGVWIVGTVVVHQVFLWLWHLSPNPYWQPQWWFYWADAWIFVGSLLATFMMAKGWNEFWIAWIAVDLVGVPLGFATGYVPTAVLYIFYGLFVLYGLYVWAKATREETPVTEPELAGADLSDGERPSAVSRNP